MILASILITDDEHQAQALSPLVTANIESLRRHHGGLEHRLFRGPEIRDFLAREYGREVLGAYDALKPYAFKADLARHCIMLRHGGLYADLSIFFLRPWKMEPGRLGIFRDFALAAPWQVANTLYWTPPGHKAVAKAIDLIVANVRARHYGASFLCPTGPVSFGKAIALTCEPGDLVTGDSAWVTELPQHPGLIAGRSHGFVHDGELVAVKRKHGGGAPAELGIVGANAYIDMWYRKDIYAAEP